MTRKISIFAIIKDSFLENIKPGLLLQSMGLAIVLLYYFNPWFGEQLNILGQWKKQGGFLFSGLSTAIFGGLLPFLVIFAKDRQRLAGKVPALLAFYLLFWFWKGMEVDFLYRVQAWIFGDSNHWLVIVKKTATDQLIYCPIWAVPTMMIFYLWKDTGFRFGQMRQKLKEDSFSQRYLRVFFSNLIVWLPAVVIIYQLPLVLQLPLFNIVLAFWTLILNSVSAK